MCETPPKEFLVEAWNKMKSDIKGYHIHMYFDDGVSKARTAGLALEIQELFGDDVKGVFPVRVVGPHTKENTEVEITCKGYKDIVQWLQMNAPAGLSILVHPDTGDDISDHEKVVWIGKPIPFNQDFFDGLKAQVKAQPSIRKP